MVRATDYESVGWVSNLDLCSINMFSTLPLIDFRLFRLSPVLYAVTSPVARTWQFSSTVVHQVLCIIDVNHHTFTSFGNKVLLEFFNFWNLKLKIYGIYWFSRLCFQIKCVCNVVVNYGRVMKKVCPVTRFFFIMVTHLFIILCFRKITWPLFLITWKSWESWHIYENSETIFQLTCK